MRINHAHIIIFWRPIKDRPRNRTHAHNPTILFPRHLNHTIHQSLINLMIKIIIMNFGMINYQLVNPNAYKRNRSSAKSGALGMKCQPVV